MRLERWLNLAALSCGFQEGDQARGTPSQRPHAHGKVTGTPLALL
jgi:hypothetical protein